MERLPASPTMLPPRRGLHQLSGPAAQAAARKAGSTVVVPWGSLEQHGPHLPVGTDALFAEHVLDQVVAALPAQLPIWCLPVQSLGFAPEHSGLALSFSLTAETLLAQVKTLADPLAAAGFQRLVLFNAHGGQISLLDAAAREVHRHHPDLGIMAWFLWDMEGVMEVIPEPERSQGLHAGLAETSLMLHLAPELVDLPLMVANNPPAPPPGLSLEQQRPTAWLTAALGSSGVIGDPSGASGALGAELNRRLVKGWTAVFQSLLHSNWPPRLAQSTSGATGTTNHNPSFYREGRSM